MNAAGVVVDDQAAIGQEWARTPEGQVEQLLPLPTDEAEPATRWWRFWRRGA